MTDAPALGVPSKISVDPYSQDSMRLPFLDIAFRDEALNILGEVSEVEETATLFFGTAYLRMPFLSEKRYRVSLPYLYSRPRADFILLCLSISLVLQRPKEISFPGDTMQSSLYVTVKCLISSLEAANHVSLDFVQSRAIVCHYEIGHGIYPAAAASIAACSSAARALGLEKKRFQDPQRDIRNIANRLAAEEEKRTWWVIINMDR